MYPHTRYLSIFVHPQQSASPFLTLDAPCQSCQSTACLGVVRLSQRRMGIECSCVTRPETPKVRKLDYIHGGRCSAGTLRASPQRPVGMAWSTPLGSLVLEQVLSRMFVNT
ncbi:ymr099c-like protein [Moniliophthora roreri]|nr:ymr099c-like protein [Moniliophthora roreri]